MVLYCDRFDRGSRQVKREPVDLVTEDYDVSLCQQVGILYVESLGVKLPLMRTHEDLSSDMELGYVLYDLVVILYIYLVEYPSPGIYEIYHFTSFFLD